MMPESDDKSCDDVSPAQVRIAAMNLLARREHSCEELSRKLLRRFKDATLVAQEIERLAAENLQSDERYAHSFVRQRISRGHGPLRISADARQRGVASPDLDAALAENAPDWHEHARQVMVKKFGVAAVQPGDAREMARRVRFMQYRGFAMEHFAALLDL
ncbi:MAG: recombination regulator RecX [Gammaproteobacteria bacterium]|nr:recombination regulator RecX [Gammaproteobacteria bacterium]